MWYKRAIENYFQNSAYELIGVTINSIPIGEDRDYYKFDKAIGYHKKKLGSLIKNMKLIDYEKGIKKFSVSIGERIEEVSELQLLLLKLVKII